jgi:hypothetical protein
MPPPGSEGFEARRVDSRKGFGLFATREFSPGESIYRLDYWSRAQMPMHSTNHSCDPNASFDEAGILVAVRRIEAGEEITYDYLAHPLPASPWNFECLCGAEGCVGWVDVKAAGERDSTAR